MKKLRANTLVEVMVALAITSFAATLAVVIYLNIERSTLPFFKIRATALATRELEQALEQRDYLDSSHELEGFLVKKKVERHPRYADCSMITVTVFDQDHKPLTHLQTYVYNEP